MNESLMARVRFLDGKVAEADGEREGLRVKVSELEDTNRDLGFFISGREKLKSLGGGGGSEGGDGGDGGNDVAGGGGGGGDGGRAVIEHSEIVEGRVEIPIPVAKESGSGGGGKKNKGKKRK